MEDSNREQQDDGNQTVTYDQKKQVSAQSQEQGKQGQSGQPQTSQPDDRGGEPGSQIGRHGRLGVDPGPDQSGKQRLVSEPEEGPARPGRTES